MISRLTKNFLFFLICATPLCAAGIERIAVTDTDITVHPEADTTGTLKVVVIEPYDSYQSSRNWQLGGDGGVIDFSREGSARLTFTAPAGAFDPQLSNGLDLIDATKSRYLAIRVKVENFTGTLPARAFVFGDGTASAAFDIIGDGEWHIARLDLATVTGTTTWSDQRTLRLDFPDGTPITGYENAEVFIDWIAVTNKPAFENPLTWGRWDKFWDLGYQAAAAIADAASPIVIDRYDGEIDRYYQKFMLVDGFTPVGNPHWVDDFSGLSYKTVTDHGFAPTGAGAGSGTIVDGVYRMSYVDASPFAPQLATTNQEINGSNTRYLHARIRMTGYTGSAPSITAGMSSDASGFSEVEVPFDPNGVWQVLHFDMATAANWGDFENVGLEVPKNAGTAADFLGATLEVDWIAATNSPEYDGTGKLAGHELKYGFEIDRLETSIVPFKGRQGIDNYSPDDFAELQPDVGKLNFTVNNLVQNVASPRVHWMQDGLSFGLNPNSLNTLMDRIASLGDMGVQTYIVLLNASNSTLVNDPNWPFINIRSSDQAPNNLYAFNTGDAYGLRYTRAALEYTAHRMSQAGVTPSNHWIYGNEIDAHWYWHNLGLIPASEFRDYFSVEFRQAALVLAKYHPEFRALLSHTHHWLSQVGNANQGMPSKVLIDELNQTWKSEGNFAWEIAAHPYPQNLFNPAFWDDTEATLDFNTTKITYKNLEVLPVYFQREALLFNDEQRGISLTEQGFHTLGSGADQALQAAAYANHWHRFKRIPGIKADIMQRLADHPNEGGLLFGILDLDKQRKASYDVFAVADTPNWQTTFDTYLPQLPFSSWDAISSVPAWTLLDLPFEEAGYTQGWQALNNVSGFSANASGNLVGTVTGTDPQIGNNNFFALARDAQRVLIRMKVDSGSAADLFWGTQTANTYSATRRVAFNTNTDDQFHIYDVDMLDHPEWKDQVIRRIRFDPTGTSSGSFEVDYFLTGKRDDFDGDGVRDEDEGIATMRDSDGDGIPDFADPSVAVAIPPDFDSWRAGFTFPPGADISPDGDADGDGQSNYEEYIFGTDPASANSINPIVSIPDNTSGTFTYTRRNPALTGVVSYRIMVSEDLQSWSQDTTAQQSAMDVGDNQLVTVTLTAELLTATRLFVRVVVP